MVSINWEGAIPAAAAAAAAAAAPSAGAIRGRGGGETVSAPMMGVDQRNSSLQIRNRTGADEAFVASFAHTVHYVQQHFPQFRGIFPNFANPDSPLQPGTQAHRALSALTRLAALAGNGNH